MFTSEREDRYTLTIFQNMEIYLKIGVNIRNKGVIIHIQKSMFIRKENDKNGLQTK